MYANYGRLGDFARLAELGIDCTCKLVIARYCGNFRGYKAKYAEAAGAAGLIIFTDPGDSGFERGEVYPEGGFANEHYIQSGSILTLDYVGDPLTPFVAATLLLTVSLVACWLPAWRSRKQRWIGPSRSAVVPMCR